MSSGSEDMFAGEEGEAGAQAEGEGEADTVAQLKDDTNEKSDGDDDNFSDSLSLPSDFEWSDESNKKRESNEESSKSEDTNEEQHDLDETSDRSGQDEGNSRSGSENEAGESTLHNVSVSDQSTSDGVQSHLDHGKTKRRKRSGFKKGVLYRTKDRRGERSSQPKSVSQETNYSGNEGESEDYLQKLGSVFAGEPSAESETSHSAFSATDTMPSEQDEDGTSTHDAQQLEQSGGLTLEKPATSKRKRKRKVPFTVRKYTTWKKSDDPPADDHQKNVADTDTQTSNVSDEQNVGAENKTQDDSSCDVNKQDFGVSVNPIDISMEAVQNATPSDKNSSEIVANYLKLTLDDVWTVSHSENMISISKIINPNNPAVERSITWIDNKVNFLVWNQELPKRNLMWNIFPSPDVDNLGHVADYLTSLSNRFDYFEVCNGVASHEDMWENFSEFGKASHHSQPPCFRSKDCSYLVVYPGLCRSCRIVQRKMMEHGRQKRRTASRTPLDRSKTNIKYLQREEITEKMKRIQQEKKLANQTVRRLRKRVDQLIKANYERIEKGLSNDFVEIMNANVDKMTQMEKIFWEQQSLALSKRDGKKKSMRWHPAMIRLALHLRMLSPAAFDFISGVISLPSSRRLFDYSQFTDIQEGVQEDMLELLKKTIEEKCTEDYQKYFSLLLDEMSIRSDLVYCSKTGELIGFTNLTSLEEELAKLEAEVQGKDFERKLAKKVLVFMLSGCGNDIKFVPAIYSTDDLSAAQLYTRVWDVIYAVEEVGAKVLLVVFDGASVNRKFIRLHFNMGDKDFVYRTVNSASGESRLLFFMLDPPHLLKTFRNCFANSFAHRNSRNLKKNDEKLSWKAIEALYSIGSKFKCTKLTKDHVFLTSFSCMKVFLAVQVFSNTVADALERFKHVSPLKEEYSEELVAFIRHMNRFFDCLNGGLESEKKKQNPDLLEYTSEDDQRFEYLEKEFLGYLQEWENSVNEMEGNYSKEEKARMQISHQSLEGVKISIYSFIEVTKFLLLKGAPSVSSRKFNQDLLEQYFSLLRRARGSDNNPNLKQVLHTRNSLLAAQGMTSSTTKGNTEILKRQMDVDESAVPVRKKSKK